MFVVSSPKWNVRHGALIGLKAAIAHGIPKTFEDESAGNWLDFLIADILLLLGLDRFYDFVGDSAVAPVKETAAQVFALLFKHLSSAPAVQLQIINRHISTLLASQVWQIQHSGLLAIKYIVAAADEKLLKSVSLALGDSIISLLAAEDEDIRSVAADVIGFLITCNELDLARIEDALNQVFLSFPSYDGSSNVSSLLHLLEVILKRDARFSFSPAQLLMQFLRSPSNSIRMQIVKLLELLGPLSSELTSQLLQSIAVELDPSVSERTFALFESLSVSINSESSEAFLSIATCPIGVPYQQHWFSFLHPSIHDLGFKKADMMVIKEQEALRQRMFVARALKGSIQDAERLESLAASNCNLHHLVYCWLGGASKKDFRETALYAEEQALWNELVTEAKVSASTSLAELQAKVASMPEEQASIVNSLLGRFQSSHEMLKARSEASLTGSLESCLKLLSVESQPVLQQFFAKKLVSEHSSAFSKDVLIRIGEFCDMKTLLSSASTSFIHSQPAWKAYDSGSDLWRSGSFCFRELVETLPLTSFDGFSLNFLAAYFAHAKSVKTEGIFQLLQPHFASNDEFVLAQSAFVFAQAVRLDSTFKLVDEFVSSLLFSAPVSVALGVVLELIYRADQVILPLIPVFLKRVMHFINDPSPSNRQYASLAFSELIRISPLSEAKFDLSLLPTRLAEAVMDSPEFLTQLQGPSSNLLDFHPPCPINAELRPYQQEGLNWLAFLRRFDLHGALCDDMGLGKTLQTLCILASDHFEAKEAGNRVQSLIICPPSLCGHWEAEIKNYCPSFVDGSVFVYSGSAYERRGLFANSIKTAEIVVTSYDVIRSDIELFSKIEWNYCILDEGHLIKNPKTKLSSAIKSLSTRRRLLLSGTPIQNNLLELWSLFDFLMPGYLGEEKEFAAAFAKPIAVAQYQQAIASSSASSSAIPSGSLAKWTSRDLDEAEAKLASLHKQVLPFIMRRMKEDVLQDLPPKIIQDFTTEMSPIQKIIYDDLLASTSIKSEISEFVNRSDKDDSGSKNTHIFRVLQYLRKLCVHPQLVVDKSHPLNERIDSEMAARNLSWSDLSIAPKFQMLKELLIECGLGEGESRGASNHRVLIFAQQKSTLDLVERLVFRAHLPDLTYLRLDGDVAPTARFPIVSQFNSDPTIDCLLLTTHVGGLGLNLTAADTVIFMDPDWNPMKDLQAMDRAHRLGQKRVVTVYRLLLKDTLEERIMGLQRWKLHVANTVVSQQNSSMKSMDTGVILDLFEASTTGAASTSSSGNAENKDSEASATAKWLKEHHGMAEAEEGEDSTNQYEREFDMQAFATDLKK